MTIKEDCAKVTHLAQGGTGGVANVDNALRSRLVVFNSDVTDAGAGAAQTWDVAVFPAALYPSGVTIISAHIVPSGIVAKNANGNTTSLFYANGIGGAPVLLGAHDTAATAWAAGTTIALPVAETTIAAGSILRITGVLAGGGQLYVPYSVTIAYKVA
jgi:hypothetical protein